jgi:hypothetical protein
MLYFHPWEFDPAQARLPLGRFSRFRTYVGLHRTRERLNALLARHSFTRAVDVARHLDRQHTLLPSFDMGLSGSRTGTESPTSGGRVNECLHRSPWLAPADGIACPSTRGETVVSPEGKRP